MIGTPVDHTALSLSGAYVVQIAALIVQPCKGSTGNWTGEGSRGRIFYFFFFFCIFLFVAGEQWRGTGVCQGEGSPYCFSHLRIKSQLYC